MLDFDARLTVAPMSAISLLRVRRLVTATEPVQLTVVLDVSRRVLRPGEFNNGRTAKAHSTVDSQHFRELARKLRDIARQCRFPGARQEILDLALRYEGRADHLDARSSVGGSIQDPC